MEEKVSIDTHIEIEEKVRRKTTMYCDVWLVPLRTSQQNSTVF